MPTLIPAATRTLAVFEIFAREKRELSNSEMARLLDVANSSAMDLMHTLHSLGYLWRTPKTLRYYPTSRLLETAQLIGNNDPLATLGREAVEQLHEKTGESAFFGALDRHAAKVIAAQASRQPLRYVVEVGDRVALHGSALGKALLGLQPPEEAAALVKELKLSRFTPSTITDAKKFLAEVALGRERGWSQTRGEGGGGVDGLAVAGWLGEYAVGISLAGPTERMQKRHKVYLQALREVAGSLFTGPS